MSTEKELIKALENMNERDFDRLLGDIELTGVGCGRLTERSSARSAARHVIRKENNYMNMNKNNAEKRSAALAILLAAAFFAAITAGAVGIGYLVNHKDVIDSYFGEGAGDNIERQGLYSGEELAVLDHFRVTKEAALSADCISTVIVTVEATDETGRDYIAGAENVSPSAVFGNKQPDGKQGSSPAAPADGGEYENGNAGPDNPDIAFIESRITDAFGDNLEGWSIRPKYGDGYMTFMFIFEFRQPAAPVTVPLELYMIDPEYNGDGIFFGTNLEEGYYLCTVEFSTEPNVAARELTGETSGKVIKLYDYILLSDQYVPVLDEDSKSLDVAFEFADGSTDRLSDDCVELLHHFCAGPDPEDTDPVTAGSDDGADTRLVFSRFIDSRNVEAVIIDGERFTQE